MMAEPRMSVKFNFPMVDLDRPQPGEATDEFHL